MLHQLGRAARTMPTMGLRPGRAIVVPSGCPAERIGKLIRPVRLLRVRDPDRGEGIASKAMHRADMRSAMAVKILNPEMAAGPSTNSSLCHNKLRRGESAPPSPGPSQS